MAKVILTFVLVVFVCAGSLLAAAGDKIKVKYEHPMIEMEKVREIPSRPMPSVSGLPSNTNAATPTTLTGWYDYQSNGGSVEQIRVNPANGNIHTTWMTAFDSTEANHNNSRRVAYAFSTNGGASWNNFNSMYVPDRRGGFPTIDLGQDAIAGSPIIANHSVITTSAGAQATIFIDSPEGGGAFGEIGPPPGFGSDEAIWPYVAGASDGSVVMSASRSTAATVHYARTADFVSWGPLTQMTGPTQSGGRYPVQANATGKVGILANTSNGTSVLGNWWTESTNNGQTWSTPVNMFAQRADAGDTLYPYVHCDFVYSGENPLFVFTEYSALATSTREDIVFWSQATGYQVAAPYDSVHYGPYNNPANPQRFFNLLADYPSIGMSGNTLVVVYSAFQPDTDRLGWNYCDLWFVTSANGGTSWAAPTRLTNTRFVDERYPSVSKWNAPGEFNVVWTQKSGASGLYAFPGASQAPGADTVRTYQMFQKVTLVGVSPESQIASGYRLQQNYPNPFNPGTKIDYAVPTAGHVSIKVYNLLGQEVATLLNENLTPGQYQVAFDGTRLPSGIYYYKMVAGNFSESRKMILLK